MARREPPPEKWRRIVTMSDAKPSALAQGKAFMKGLMAKAATGGLGPQATRAQRNAQIVKMLVLVICVFTIGTVVMWGLGKLTLKQRDCTTMNALYDRFPAISSVRLGNPDYKHNLRDYYIKTAYNCCCPGTYKNAFVDLCALKDCIKQGARCLDFAIYDVAGAPVIAASSVDSFTVKETYNTIPFADAMNTVASQGFSGAATPCAGDPLILHFRIQSSHPEMYQQMADSLYATLENRMLGKKYSYEYFGKNLGRVPIKDLTGKVIIIVDRNTDLLGQTALDEYVNICSNSMYMRALTSDQVQFSHDVDELTEYNKKQMSIVLPNLTAKAQSPPSALAMSYGCQFVAMAFQALDENVQYNTLFFDEAGSAFALKPAHLRYVPVTVTVPDPPPREYSFGARKVKSDYYSFDI